MITEEFITVIEYNRACYHLSRAKTEERRMALQETVDKLREKLESYKGGKDDTRVQENEKTDSKGRTSDLRALWWKDNKSR
jgi:hypothetical protein